MPQNETREKKHYLHEIIGDLILSAFANSENITIILDSDCGGNQRIPLFCVPDKSRDAIFCNVDIAILSKEENSVKVIIEIEESDIKPTNICGKYLTSALSQYLIHESLNNKPIPIDENATFIQILNTSGLSDDSVKDLQIERIKEAISILVQTGHFKIRKYEIITFKYDDFDGGSQNSKKLIDCIHSAL